MVQVVMGFLDDAPNMETKLSVIDTLRTITEGKVRPVSDVVDKLSIVSNQILHDRSLSRSSEPE